MIKKADVNIHNNFNGSLPIIEAGAFRNYDIDYADILIKSGADYKQPIFYRPDYSIPIEKQDPNDKGEPMYLVDVLRENFFDFDADEYKYKMIIVDFLKNKGIDYRSTPIPNYINKKSKRII